MHKHNYGFDSGYLTVILIGNLSWNSTDDTLLQVCLSLRQLAFLAHVVSLQCPFSILRLGPALSFPMILWLVALHLSRFRHIRLVNVIVSNRLRCCQMHHHGNRSFPPTVPSPTFVKSLSSH